MFSVINRGERQKPSFTKSKLLDELGNNCRNNRDCICKVFDLEIWPQPEYQQH